MFRVLLPTFTSNSVCNVLIASSIVFHYQRVSVRRYDTVLVFLGCGNALSHLSNHGSDASLIFPEWNEFRFQIDVIRHRKGISLRPAIEDESNTAMGAALDRALVNGESVAVI